MTPSWLLDYQHEINSTIDRFFATRYIPSHGVEKEFESALYYAVEGGGKRIRPILAVLAYEYVREQGNAVDAFMRDELLRIVIGIEFIHCFTLVHDDLPCMDNDEIRRGKPTVWKVYGETMAVLVGDTLQTMGFECLAESGNAKIVTQIAHALGDLGVARGQVRDTLLLQKDLTLDELLRLHDEKTGVFIAQSLLVGGILAGANSEQLRLLEAFGILLGRAFQIQDDILDYEGESSVLGKKAGKDVLLGKGIVASIGIESSKSILIEIENSLKELLSKLSSKKFDDIRQFVIKRVS